MSTWSFPYDALTAGISGTVDWLKEEEHLFLSPVPTVPRSQLTELPKDGSVTEFFPGAVLPFDSPESFESYGQAGEIYLEKAPSDYSPQGYEEKENVYQYQANQVSSLSLCLLFCFSNSRRFSVGSSCSSFLRCSSPASIRLQCSSHASCISNSSKHSI